MALRDLSFIFFEFASGNDFALLGLFAVVLEDADFPLPRSFTDAAGFWGIVFEELVVAEDVFLSADFLEISCTFLLEGGVRPVLSSDFFTLAFPLGFSEVGF